METLYVGIDVSKDTLDVTLRWDGRNHHHKVFDNEPGGIGQVQKWLEQQRAGMVQVCLEATGQYGEEVSERLYERGWRVSVVNPLCIKAYARSHLKRTQTDKADAGLLAEYGDKEQPRAWQPPSPLRKRLRALSRRIDDLEGMRQAERNRWKATKHLDPTIASSLQSVIDLLTQLIQETKHTLFQLLDQDEELKRQKKLLMSIKGIGQLTAVRFLAELGDLHEFTDARQLAAFLGLTPEFKKSGKSVSTKPRLSKRGNSAVRKMLYMPAVSAKNTNKIVEAFCNRLALSRKCDMSLIGAAMHKLVHLMFGVVHTGLPFDPNYCNLYSIAY